MRTLARQIWYDENGLIISAELITIVTILVLGLIVGMSCLQASLVNEYQDIGMAVSSLNQSYSYGGIRGHRTRCGNSSWKAGSAFYDRSGSGLATSGARTADLGQGIRARVIETPQCPTTYQPSVPSTVLPAIESPCPQLPAVEAPCPQAIESPYRSPIQAPYGSSPCPPAYTVPGGGTINSGCNQTAPANGHAPVQPQADPFTPTPKPLPAPPVKNKPQAEPKPATPDGSESA